MTYPYQWITKSGHSVVATNPTRGHFDFNIVTNDGRAEQLAFDESSPGPKNIQNTGGFLSEMEHEVFIEWSQLSQTI